MKAGVKKEKSPIIIPLLCGLAGILYFILIFGWQNVNPNHTAWVLNGGGDNFQHYIGWRFFRDSPWIKHVLFFQNLNYPSGTSVIVTDSNPLMCLIFKCFRKYLSVQFQFNGIWLVLCYGLAGFLSARIGIELTRSKIWACVCSAFVLLNPVILQRAAIHDNLAGHWIILLAFLLWITRSKSLNAAGWAFCTIMAMLIHVYFLPMILLFLLFQTIQSISEKEKVQKILLPWVASAGAFLLVYYLAGFRYILPQSGSYGELSMNLNAFFNSDGTSDFLPALSEFPLQYEGFNYWGLGLLVLCAVTLILMDRQHYRRALLFIFPSLLWILLAASQNITWGNRILFSFLIPEKVLSWLSVFRSSGRLGWPFYYLVLFGCASALSKSQKKRFTAFLIGFCLLLQIIDFSNFRTGYYRRFHSVSDVSENLTAELTFPSGTKHIAVSDGKSSDKNQLALFAADHHLTFNQSANARAIQPIFGGPDLTIEETFDQKAFKKDTVYFILDSRMQTEVMEKYSEYVKIQNNWIYLYGNDLVKITNGSEK